MTHGCRKDCDVITIKSIMEVFLLVDGLRDQKKLVTTKMFLTNLNKEGTSDSDYIIYCYNLLAKYNYKTGLYLVIVSK